MVERDRHLNKTLQEFLLRCRRRAPDVLERLVGVKKGGTVEQFNSPMIVVKIHTALWHTQSVG